MVKETCTERYECPYCNRIYDTHIDADICASECNELNREDIIEHDIELIFQCEMCGKEYKKSLKAEQCEENHKRFKDKHYNEYIILQNTIKLEKAANHKNQTKLKWN